MNNLAFQIYGTKKATPFQSVWKTDNIALGGELANRAASSLPTDWSGTNLLTGGYTHNGSGSSELLFSIGSTAFQNYQIICTLSAGSTGSVVINLGNVSSAPLSNSSTTIMLTPTAGSGTLKITPVDFVGTVSLSVKQSSSAANQIQLPITSIPVGKSIWIDWGDNSYTNANNSNYTANRTHTYSTPGEYTVRILGDNFNFGFTNGGTNDRLKLKSISSWGKLKFSTYSFYGCSNVTMSGITDIPDLTGVGNFQYLFGGCNKITTIGRINEWNTTSVTGMTNVFDNCSLFNSNISNWNVSNVTNFYQMFYNANSFNNGFALGVPNQLPWNTSNVTNMSFMFSNNPAFNSNLGTGTTPWNVSKVTTFQSMCQGASKFNNGNDTAPINNWNIGGSVTGTITLESMFSSASAFNREISGWDVSKVNTLSGIFANAINFENGLNENQNPVTLRTGLDGWNIVVTGNMYGVFLGASKFNRPLSNWNTTSVTWMLSMFQNAVLFNQDISSWNVGNVTNMGSMFQGAGSFNQNIGNWNVTKVTNFQSMFQGASAFNNNGSSDIDNWDINTASSANVNMQSMFSSTGSFNQPLNSWNTSEVISMSSMFTTSTFNNGLSSGVASTLAWNTGKVTNMSSMFGVNSRFNCNIQSWNVSNVTDMSSMFEEAGAFNQELAGWERTTPNVSSLSSVTNMGRMFYRNFLFNKPIGNWNVSSVTDMNNMFAGAFNVGFSPFNQDISNWNVSNVTTMAGMFTYNNAFNQTISNWNVPKVNSFASMFNTSRYNQPLNLLNIGGDASVTTINMSSMFLRNGYFNQDISMWNTSKVTNMSAMFYNDQAPVSTFNQPIGSWNVGNVTNMGNMFQGATAFNQPLENWDVSKVTNFSNFMNGKTPATFSSTNLDAIYNGWSALPSVQPNLTNVSFGTAKYTQAGKPGRDVLTSTVISGGYNWAITDGLLRVSSTSNNGGLIRVATTLDHGFITGNSVYIYGVEGTTNANGTWTVTKVSNLIIELQGSIYNGAHVINTGNVILP